MPILTTAAAFVGGFLADTATDFVKDQLKEPVQQRLAILRSVIGQREIPINHDIQKAVRRSHLLAGLEVARWGRRQWLFEPDINEDAYWEADAAYRLILDYLDGELARFIKNDYIPNKVVVSESLYLNFTKPSEAAQETVQRIQQDVLDELIQELQKHLHGLQYQHELPDEFCRAVRESWTDGDHTWTVFGVMCDFFHEFIKTDERLRAIIQTEWLADVKTNVDYLTTLLDKLGGDFVATYGKIPTYFAEILERLNPQPLLRYDFRAGKHADFTFRSRYVPFVGREPEWQKLRNFSDDPTQLGWCLLIGPGGSGKSRLALELCIDLTEQRTLYAGFMQSDHVSEFSWTTWQPTCPTLIVIDYVALAHEPVLKALRTLKNRAEIGKLDFSVKFLLLERDTRDTWYEQALRQANTAQIPTMFGNVPITLTALDWPLLWRIILYMVRAGNRPDPDPYQILTKLYEIDALGRPLFAVFVGYALAKGAEMIEWDKVQLVQYLLDRHIENIWLPAANDDKQRLHKHLNLLAVVTMAGGLDEKQMDELLDRACNLDNPYKWLPDDDLDEHLYRLISPGAPDRPRYAPLEPDIFGEYFVLQQLKKMGAFPRTERNKAQLSYQEAWALNHEQTGRFTYRLFQDFSHLPYTDDSENQFMPLNFFVQNPLGKKVEREPLRWWAGLLFVVISHYGNKQAFPQANNLYGELRQLVIDKPLDEVVIVQAKAAVNLIYALDKVQEFAQAIDFYKELRQLATDKPLDEVVTAQANSAFRLITDLSQAREFVQATTLYKELQQLATDKPLDEVVIWQVKAALNLMTAISQIQDRLAFTQALNLYGDLRQLAIKKPLDEVVIWQAKAAYNLIYALGLAKEFAQASNLYSELRQLAIDKPLDEVVIEQANSAFNLTTDLCQAKEFGQATVFYKELQQLAIDKHLDEVLIAQAKAVFRIITDLGQAKEFAQATDLYSELRQLVIDKPLDEVVIRQANATVNLVACFSHAGLLPQAIDFYKELRQLAIDRPLDEVVIAQAKAALNFMTNLRQSNSFGQMIEMFLGELLPLAEQKQQAAIWLETIKAIAQILSSVGVQLTKDSRRELEGLFLQQWQAYHKETIWKEDADYIQLLKIGQYILSRL